VTITFSTPAASCDGALHHEDAARGNIEAAQRALSALSAVLSGAADYDKILLRAAAGAGKSYALVRMVREALYHASCTRVAVTAFANKQVFPLAGELGRELGAPKVCLFVAQIGCPTCRRMCSITSPLLPRPTTSLTRPPSFSGPRTSWVPGGSGSGLWTT
jgi:hypothetical protein